MKIPSTKNSQENSIVECIYKLFVKLLCTFEFKDNYLHAGDSSLVILAASSFAVGSN